MRHGQIIGHYVPASVEESLLEKESLKQAVSKLDELLKEWLVVSDIQGKLSRSV